MRTLVSLTIAVLCWGGAIYLSQLHVRTGPSQQSIGIRWAPQATDLERRTVERRLRLRAAAEQQPGTWTYRLDDHSRDTIRQIVSHPLVVDTNHIDRRAMRIRIDAPAVPGWLRVPLASDLGLPLALAAFLAGAVALWPARRGLTSIVRATLASPGVDLVLSMLVLAAGFVFFADNGHGVDENIHYDQVARFTRGDWTLNPVLTTIPGFHALVAAVVVLAGGIDEFRVRLVVFLLSVATVLTFRALAHTVWPHGTHLRTLQFTLLPILFPQFFLVYTDVASLLFVLLMLLAAARGHHGTAGVAGLMACLMRQNNVIWVLFAMTWSHLRDYGWTWQPLPAMVRRYWTYAATGGALVAFVVANGGQVALGDDAASHPIGIYGTNPFFMLFLAAFLFAPLWWGYRQRAFALLRQRQTWLFVAALLPMFWFGFVNDHPHNNERADYFLPNALLLYFSGNGPLRLLFFMPAALAAVFFAATPLRTPWWLLYPFTIAFLLPEWLVVPRYYLIPFTIFLLAREPATLGSERMQTAFFGVLSLAAFLIVERAWGWI